MRIIQINSTCGVGSTGKICVGISEILTDNNVENYILYSSKSNGYPLGISCSDNRYVRIQAAKSRVLGNYGFNSKKATRKIISEIKRIHPDIVHLHNIHGHDCNLEMLFQYFKQNKTRLIWTFHDCWAFTAYCPHFTMVKCDKWKTTCSGCVQSREYSWFLDKSQSLFEKKKQLFMGLALTIVTPSAWLAGLVKQSFLRDFPVKIINNGIDLSIFHPVESEVKRKYHISEEKKILLGVAFDWGVRKGLDVFVDLSKRLDEQEYQIILVGTNDEIDRHLPKMILSIHRTGNQQELAELYSAADLFVNPTREENYPTVNMEALACGTPVLTFRTGGSPEIIDETCGSVVECDDIDALERAVVRICTEKPYTNEACLNKATKFSQNEKIKEYLKLYERINTTGT